MNLKKSLFVVALVLTLCVTASAQTKSWLHVHVDSEDSEQVKVNLPLSVVSTVLPIVADKELNLAKFQAEEIEFGGKKLTVEEIRAIWNSVREGGSYELANVVSDDTTVRVFIDEEFLMVKTDEAEGDKVNVQIPVRIVDALFSGSENQLNIQGALEALQDIGSQQLVLVEAEDATVRVWIDESNSG
jgi:hypothetical protein